METYAEITDARTAAAFLKSTVTGDSSERIRLEAVEILSELDDDAGVSAIRELAGSSDDARVRNRAREILSER